MVGGELEGTRTGGGERERVPLIFPTSEDRTSIIQRNAVIRSSPSVMVPCVFLAFHLSLPHAPSYIPPLRVHVAVRGCVHNTSRRSRRRTRVNPHGRVRRCIGIVVDIARIARARMSPRFLRRRKHSRERTAVGGRRRGSLGKERDRAGFSPGTHGG